MKLDKKILHNMHMKLYEYNEKKRLMQYNQCKYCGNKYKTTIHHSKYCTDSCRIKAEQDNNKKRVQRYRRKHYKPSLGTSNLSPRPQQDTKLEARIIQKEKQRLLR